MTKYQGQMTKEKLPLSLVVRFKFVGWAGTRIDARSAPLKVALSTLPSACQ
ncbi:hypothetical protein LKK83_06210 [Phormidium sp. CCY1219]|nr:hypothetical protein [Phormidium sp. CCY1219]